MSKVRKALKVIGFLILFCAAFNAGRSTEPTPPQTPIAAAESVPSAPLPVAQPLTTFCWVEADGEPLSGTNANDIPVGSTIIDCKDIQSYADAQPCIIMPDGYNPQTTPVVEFDSSDCYVPEESPNGGHPVSKTDDSYIYSGGWMLNVNSNTGSVKWVETRKSA